MGNLEGVGVSRLSSKPRLQFVGSLRALAMRGFFAALLLSACDSGEASDFSTVDAGANAGEISSGTSSGDAELEPDAGVVDDRPWPKPHDQGESRGGVLMEKYPDAEPSGIVFEEASSSYYLVSDDGWLFQLDEEGGVLGHWDIGGDPESLALDPKTKTLLVGFEGGSVVRFWDPVSRAFVEDASCSLDLKVDGKKGFEAMAYVPARDAPQSWADLSENPSGYIVAGTQASDTLSVYPVDLCVGGGRLTALDFGSALKTPKDDISGLDYDPRVGVLWVLHDKRNHDTLDKMTLDGQVLRTFELPNQNFEGVSVRPNCEAREARVDVADDGGDIISFEGLPVDCRGGTQ